MWDSLVTDPCDVCQCPSRSNRSESSSSLDKENIQQVLSPIKNEELSFYGSNASTAPLCTGSPNHCNHTSTRRPLEDYDPNSRDSGFGTYSNDGRFSLYQSPSRGSSIMDEDYFEDFSDIEPLEDNNLPQDFGTLISGPVNNCNNQPSNLPKDLAIRPLFRRALSLQNERTTPNSSRVRFCLFRGRNDESPPFKRPFPPLEFDSSPTSLHKKAKLDLSDSEQEIDKDDIAVPCVSFSPPVLRRSVSSTEESIMSAVQRSSTEPDLIGDFSKTFCLPLTQGRHRDLKSITAHTLAQLIRGDFKSNIASFKIIDCRYPYEYEGGHIDGAVNLYTKEQCLELLHDLKGPKEETDKRSNILVFHCEFSSERGPNLYRYLRKQDRQLNEDAYPSLNYPEIYLLEGGYKQFFELYSGLCVPIAYKEMLHPEHGNDLRYFRLKSRTWNADTRQRPQRPSLKRLGL